MKKIILLIAIAGIGCTVPAQFSKELYLTKSLSGTEIKNIVAKTTGGRIDVTGGDLQEPRIEVYVQRNNIRLKSLSKEEIRQRLEEDYELTIETDNNQLTAICRQVNRNMHWKEQLNVSFKIYVPSDVSSELSTSGGTIRLAGLNGNQRFSTSGGSLHIDRLRGKIHGKTSGGTIRIANSHEDIDLHTSGGGIHADDCSGTIKLVTSGGTVRLNDLKGNITASTSGGTVHADDIDGELSAHTSGGRVDLKRLRGSVDASTSGGAVHVQMLEVGKYVKLNNSGGNIDLTMPAGKGLDLKLHGEKVKTSTLNNFNGELDDDYITGSLNGGGIPVTVHSSSGKIKLTLTK